MRDKAKDRIPLFVILGIIAAFVLARVLTSQKFTGLTPQRGVFGTDESAAAASVASFTVSGG